MFVKHTHIFNIRPNKWTACLENISPSSCFGIFGKMMRKGRFAKQSRNDFLRSTLWSRAQGAVPRSSVIKLLCFASPFNDKPPDFCLAAYSPSSNSSESHFSRSTYWMSDFVRSPTLYGGTGPTLQRRGFDIFLQNCCPSVENHP